MGEVPPPELGRKLSYPSLDDISNLCFSDYSDHLLVASYDGKVRLYDASADVPKGQFAHGAALLDCCFRDDSSCFTASMDKTVCRCDFHRGEKVSLGTHDSPVSCVEYSHASGIVVTGSWDKTVRFWDCREATRVGIYQQPERVCSMSLIDHRLVVATEGRDISIYDLRCMPQTREMRESSLQCRTRCVRCYPNGTGYALSSEEGRVALECFDMSETGQAKNYKFRTEPVDGRVYSVNAIAFHPTYCTFATGCFAGYVNVWDGKRKKPIYKFSRYPTSVASLSFSRDGLLLAVASSYTYEEGDILHEYAAIFVQSVNEAQVKPKP